MCVRHSLLQFKVVHRAHFSKLRLSKMFQDIRPNCDKCQSPNSSLSHMFWTCPSLENFWRNIFQTLSLTLDTVKEPDPLLALFGVMKDGGLPKTKRAALSFALPLACRSILLRWKGTYLPTHSQWLQDLMSCPEVRKNTLLHS